MSEHLSPRPGRAPGFTVNYYPTIDRDAPDTWTDEGAKRLKEKIEAFWKARGHEVHVSLLTAGFHPAIRETRVDLRSDLRNGFPKGFRP